MSCNPGLINFPDRGRHLGQTVVVSPLVTKIFGTTAGTGSQAPNLRVEPYYGTTS